MKSGLRPGIIPIPIIFAVAAIITAAAATIFGQVPEETRPLEFVGTQGSLSVSFDCLNDNLKARLSWTQKPDTARYPIYYKKSQDSSYTLDTNATNINILNVPTGGTLEPNTNYDFKVEAMDFAGSVVVWGLSTGQNSASPCGGTTQPSPSPSPLPSSEPSASPSPSPLGQPDLVIAGITLAKTNVLPQETISASVTVKNQGDGQAQSSILGYYNNLSSAPNCSSIRNGTNNTTLLSAGNQLTFSTYSFTAPATAGNYTFWAMADSACQVTNELSETNNTGFAYYQVTAAGGIAPTPTPTPTPTTPTMPTYPTPTAPGSFRLITVTSAATGNPSFDWTDSAGATSYYIYVGEPGVAWYWIKQATTSNTTWAQGVGWQKAPGSTRDVPQTLPNGTWMWNVAATNASGLYTYAATPDSYPEFTVGTTTPTPAPTPTPTPSPPPTGGPAQPPGSPRNLQVASQNCASANSVRVTISWDHPTGGGQIAKYRIGLWINGQWDYSGDLDPATKSHTWQNLNPNADYAYNVAAGNTAGWTWGPASIWFTTPACQASPTPSPTPSPSPLPSSAPSASPSPTPTPAPTVPGSFTQTTPAAGDTNVSNNPSFDWSDATGATYYWVYVGESGVDWHWVKKVTVSNTSWASGVGWQQASGSTIAIPQTLTDGNWSWIVAAVNSAGTTWSEQSQFRVGQVAAAKPDLTIESVTFKNASGKAQTGFGPRETVVIELTAKNIGAAANNAPLAVDLYENASQKPICDQTAKEDHQQIVTTPIQPNSSQSVRFSFIPQDRTPGTKTIWLLVDSACRNAESDEDNNTSPQEYQLLDIKPPNPGGVSSGLLNLLTELLNRH